MLTRDDLKNAVARADYSGMLPDDCRVAADAVLDALIEGMESIHGREELRQIRGEESR